MGGTSVYRPRKYDWGEDDETIGRSADSYATDDKRVFTGSRTGGIEYPIDIDISTESIYPIKIILDVTGSMSHMPRFFLERLPVLYNESNALLQGYGPDEMKEVGDTVSDELEISIIAVGDVNGDVYPLQVTNYAKREGLIEEINKIYPEGGGGGQGMESYELALYYALRHSNYQKGVKPLCVVFGDEAFYDILRPFDVKKFIGDDIDSGITSTDLIREAEKNFNLFILRPELSAYSDSRYNQIHKKWEHELGPEKVRKLDDPERVIDNIVALSGVISNNWEKAEKMLRRRQRPEQVDSVVRTLHPLIYEESKK